jgi:putative oxidoreductase
MTSTNKSKALNISLWVAQVLLALMFFMTGTMKTTQPIEELAKSMSWVNDFSPGMVRFIGASELLGGIGLLLPSLLRIRPLLTPLAALGLFIVMSLAFIYHVSKGEYELLPINSILGTIALFIVWGRYKKVPIQPKS